MKVLTKWMMPYKYKMYVYPLKGGLLRESEWDECEVVVVIYWIDKQDEKKAVIMNKLRWKKANKGTFKY